MSNDLNQYLEHQEDFTGRQDEEQMLQAALLCDLNNIRQTQQSYGVPSVGDLFRAQNTDIQETINSIYYMLKQRVTDIDFRQEVRQKLNKAEAEKHESGEQAQRLKTKVEQLTQELKDTQNQLRNADTKLKSERDKATLEKEELQKQLMRLQHKETQYKHDIRNKEVALQKAQDNLKQKIFEKASKAQIQGQMETTSLIPHEVKPSKYPDGDFNMTIAKGQEEIYKHISEENNQLKDCLRQLQRELFDIVDLKTDIYKKRFSSEHNRDLDTEDQIKHEIEAIREDFFNMPFEEAGKELIDKFQQNFLKLKEFMMKIDGEVAKLETFSEKTEEYDDPTSKYSGISSIAQLKSLLRNYEALVEGQHTLINSSITKMAKIPPPDEIAASFSRFQVLKDSDLDEMRNFLGEHKVIMQQQYREFTSEKNAFDDMTKRMETEKLKISEERELIEKEVRNIRDLNNQLNQQLALQKA